MFPKLQHPWTVLLLAAMVAPAALGQSEVATLTGAVTDASGARLANVMITVTNQQTNVPARSYTTETGLYVIPGLRPGVYSIEAALDQFKQYRRSGVTLQVNQTARIDISLAVGDVTEKVTVTGEAPVLETQTSSRGAVIDERKILELPLNGRDYNQLAMLSPGVLAPTPRLQSIGFKGVFNVNGNRAFQNAFVLDGVDNVSYSSSYRGGNVQIIQPSVEALQEFKIQTNGYTAEFGRSAGAIINAAIKSGSNQLHGSAYEFHRNRALDANNFFSNKSGADKPFRLRNQFGGTIGGPIRRDRTFFFADYEGLRDRTGAVRFSSAPQLSWKEGKFTVPIANPFNPSDTGEDFRRAATSDCNDGHGNCWIIPRNLIDPVGERWVNVAPAPNTGAPGQIDNNYVYVPVERNHTDQFDTRVDHNLKTGVNLFGRYSFSDTDIFKPAPRPGLAEGSYNDTFGLAAWRSQALAVGGTWTITPRTLSETRFGYTRGDYDQKPPNYDSGCPDKLIGLTGLSSDESLCGGLPPMGFPGGSLRRLSRTTSVPQFQTPRGYNLRQSLTWVRSSHNLKFGGEHLRISTGVRDVGSLLGNFSFSGRFSGQNGEYQGGVADLLMGLPTSYSQDSNTVFHIWQPLTSFFVQDDWRITPKLTLNLGLRYEFAPSPRERDNQWANFDPKANQFVSAADGSIFSRALIKPSWLDFAPRIGAAYSVFRHTVIRGAYGVFYNHTARQGREGMLGFNPPFIVQASVSAAGGSTLKVSDAPFQLQNGVPEGFVDLSRVNLATVSRKAQQMDQKSPRVQQWNFSVQQQLREDLLFEVAYVGNRGDRMPAFRNLNPYLYSFNATTGAPVTGDRTLAGIGLLGDIQYQENNGVSNYHSLQTRLEKRFSGGLSALVSYTWGKALTDSVDHLSTSGVGNGVDIGAFREPQNGLDRHGEYGPSEFDVAHRFVASAVWQIPFGRGRRWGSSSPGAVNALLGGWEFSPIVTAQTGLGLTINQSCLMNLGGERRCRPNRIGSGELPDSQRTVDNYIDASAFKILQVDPTKDGFVANQIFGNSGVGILRGPGLFNIDFNLNKTFLITERRSMQFRAEFFNALNRANFSVPGVTLSAGFGQIVSTSTEARIIQFAMKYRF